MRKIVKGNKVKLKYKNKLKRNVCLTGITQKKNV